MTTRHSSAREPDDREALLGTIQKTQWMGLLILKTDKGCISDGIGYVEFVAFFDAGEAGQLHERSRFVHENGQWYYLDGRILAPLAFGRNTPCWCGSGKKFKKCHGQ